jgi:hypothetical protein
MNKKNRQHFDELQRQVKEAKYAKMNREKEVNQKLSSMFNHFYYTKIKRIDYRPRALLSTFKLELFVGGITLYYVYKMFKGILDHSKEQRKIDLIKSGLVKDDGTLNKKEDGYIPYDSYDFINSERQKQILKMKLKKDYFNKKSENE